MYTNLPNGGEGGRASVEKYGTFCCLHVFTGFHAGTDREFPSWLEALPKGCLWRLNSSCARDMDQSSLKQETPSGEGVPLYSRQ